MISTSDSMQRASLNNISPEMRSSASISPSPTNETIIKPSRHSPDQDDDGVLWNKSSLLPPQRPISELKPLESPSKVVATFREVLAETPVFSGPGSKTTTADAKEQQLWMCLLCISKNSMITSPEVCAVCGWKRHDDSKSRLASLTKAGLDLAKKWKQDKDDDSVSETQQSNRFFPRKNSFSSGTSIGSASTQKVSNTTNDPVDKKPKSSLGDLAMYLLSSTSSRKLKTPHMSSDDEDTPTRPNKVYAAPSPTSLPAPPLTDSKPPRPPPRPPSSTQVSPTRPPRQQRRGYEANAMVPELAGRPIPDDASHASLALPKRPSALGSTTLLDTTSTLPKPSSSSRFKSLLMQIQNSFESSRSDDTTSVEDATCDEEQALNRKSRSVHVDPQDSDEQSQHNTARKGFRSGCDTWEDGLSPPVSSADEVPTDKHASFDTEATDDLADISLHIDTMENGERSEDAVSISIFSDEQSSHPSVVAPKSRKRCYCFSYPLRFCILMAVLAGAILATLSTVIDWNHVGDKLREAFGHPAHSSTSDTSSGSNVPTSPPIWAGANYSSKWVRSGSDIVIAASIENAVNQVVLGRDGSFLAVGSPSSDQTTAPDLIRLFQLNGDSWKQHGGDIDRDVISRVTKKFAFADGPVLTVAVASPGSIRVYTSSSNETEWRQLGSPILLGGGGNSHVEFSVALSADGRTVAAGIVELDVVTHSNIFSAKYWGIVTIHSYDSESNDWIQVGSEIVLSRLNEADANITQTGVEVKLSSNGQILAVRDWLTGNGHLESRSNVQVYQSVYQSANSSVWQQKGSVITSDQVDGGFAFAEDGSLLAITNSLESNVLQFNPAQKDWNPFQGSLPGGSSIALAQNASVVAIGTSATNEYPGSVETYTYDTTAVSHWSRVASDLAGSSAADGFGSSISMSQNDASMLAVGLQDSVQVYRLWANA